MQQKLVFKAAEIAALDEVEHRHQFNENAVRWTKSLGDLAGLEFIGFHLVRVEPGRETTQFHFHENSDEFIYIISGELTLEYGEEIYTIGPSDFVAFPAHGMPHMMTNNSDVEATYLMGGSRPPFDICNYPRDGLRMYNIKGVKEYASVENIKKV